MKLKSVISLIILTTLLAACNINEEQPSIRPLHQYGASEIDGEREEMLYLFINEKLKGEYGVFTNYQDTSQQETNATGHEILSESLGLQMRYYSLTSQQKSFDESLMLIKNVFEMESGFSYRYSPKKDKQYTVNAAVDDLRIIRALYEAADIFDETSYYELANQYGERFLNYNSNNGNLYDFYDDYYKIHNNFITLCYIDLRTIERLPKHTEKQLLLKRMSNIVQQGYLSDEFPFYETRYLYETESYQSEDINTIESMLTILSLSEVGKQRPESIRYIKEHVQRGTLYGKYSKAGVPKTDVQSTSIYAIAAMIGSEIGDQELYKQSIEQMEKFQVLNKDNELYGAFGNLKSLQAYSFDNLQALLAYAY